MGRTGPQRLALIDGDALLSRGDLIRWCRMAGDTLRHPAMTTASTDGPRLCAVLVPRSWAVPFGLIAARFAGLAFLLLDPAQPLHGSAPSWPSHALPSC